MIIKEKRPFPVPAEVVMRCTLFTLANMQAKLQVYNEQNGVIVATVNKWMGLQKHEVVAKVRRFDNTSILEIEAPDAEKANQILSQVSAYVTDGAGKVQADATIQWVDINQKKENRARRQQIIDRAKGVLPGQSSSTQEALPAVVDEQGNEIVQGEVIDEEESALVPVPIPDNPGVLVKNPQNKMIEIKVDPAVFADRTAYLEICQACAATVMRGSKYCSSCGRPLTLEAVQPELQSNAKQAASKSLQSGLLAIVFTLLPFVLLILPEMLLGTDASLSFLERIGQSLTPIRLLLSLIIGVLPSMLLGWRAIAQAQQAGWYQNLNALFDTGGQSRAAFGKALGWLAIYISIGWVLLTAVAYFVQ